MNNLKTQVIKQTFGYLFQLSINNTPIYCFYLDFNMEIDKLIRQIISTDYFKIISIEYNLKESEVLESILQKIDVNHLGDYNKMNNNDLIINLIPHQSLWHDKFDVYLVEVCLNDEIIYSFDYGLLWRFVRHDLVGCEKFKSMLIKHNLKDYEVIVAIEEAIRVAYNLGDKWSIF